MLANISKEDPILFPIAPFKPQKTDYYRQLIENTMKSIGIDPEKHFDKTLFTVKKENNHYKGLTNRTKHRLPVLPSRDVYFKVWIPENESLYPRKLGTPENKILAPR